MGCWTYRKLEVSSAQSCCSCLEVFRSEAFLQAICVWIPYGCGEYSRRYGHYCGPCAQTTETTIERDKKGGFGVLPLPLIVPCGGFPRKFVSDLEPAHLSGSTHFGGS